MKLLSPALMLGLLAVALVLLVVLTPAFGGGPVGMGVLVGGLLGLGLGAGTTLRQRRLLRTRPERALNAFALGFVTKLMVLLAATCLFYFGELESIDPVGFCLACLFAMLLATAIGWLGPLPETGTSLPGADITGAGLAGPGLAKAPSEPLPR